MQLTLRNYAEVLSKDLIKKTAKTVVRECDEIEKGKYVAYVDEGEESFDVMLAIDIDGHIVEHSCDCPKNKAFCLHKISLLVSIVEGRKEKKPVKNGKPRRKPNPVDELLQNVNANDLKDWIKETLTNNKDLEVAFLHRFSNEEKKYTPTEIKNITDGAVAAVIKRRGRAEASELKRIVDLWKKVHSPIIDQYISNVGDEAAFLNIQAVIECCLNLQDEVDFNSKRVDGYVKGVLQKLTGSFIDLQSDDAWEIAVSYFTNNIIDVPNHGIREYYLAFLLDLFALANDDRKRKLAISLCAAYPKINISHGAFTRTVFSLAKQCNLLKQYIHLFKPISFENDYNIELIDWLIENDNLKSAEQHCRKQIQTNYYDTYNTIYLERLKKIALIQNDDIKLLNVCKELLPLTFDFEDYIVVTRLVTDADELKMFRNKIFAKARNYGFSQSEERDEFAFRLLDSEGKYNKMVELIKHDTAPHFFIHYAAKMASAKLEFLDRLFANGRFNYFANERNIEDVFFEPLLKILTEHYSSQEMLAVIKKHKTDGWTIGVNLFADYVYRLLSER
jgi:hypothetical protein